VLSCLAGIMDGEERWPAVAAFGIVTLWSKLLTPSPILLAVYACVDGCSRTVWPFLEVMVVPCVALVPEHLSSVAETGLYPSPLPPLPLPAA
jgi:hypothetical protein